MQKSHAPKYTHTNHFFSMEDKEKISSRLIELIESSALI